MALIYRRFTEHSVNVVLVFTFRVVRNANGPVTRISQYQDHLGGYNRVADSDIPLRERLYSRGRNYYIKLNASW